MDGFRHYAHAIELPGQQFNGVRHDSGPAPVLVGIDPAPGVSHHPGITGIQATMGTTLYVVDAPEAQAAFVKQ